MTARKRFRLAAGGIVLVLLAGCDDAAQPPTTVVVNTPAADGGQVVLLTVMIGVAFLALVAAGVAVWGWAQERHARRDAERARREAEDAVLALTGQPIDRLRLSLLHGALAGERPSPAEPPSRRAIEGWRE